MLVVFPPGVTDTGHCKKDEYQSSDLKPEYPQNRTHAAENGSDCGGGCSIPAVPFCETTGYVRRGCRPDTPGISAAARAGKLRH